MPRPLKPGAGGLRLFICFFSPSFPSVSVPANGPYLSMGWIEGKLFSIAYGFSLGGERVTTSRIIEGLSWLFELVTFPNDTRSGGSG